MPPRPRTQHPLPVFQAPESNNEVLRVVLANLQCLQLRCKYLIFASECKSFLPVTSYDSLKKIFAEDGTSEMGRFHSPFPNCSVLLDLSQHFSRASSSSHNQISVVSSAQNPIEILGINYGVAHHDGL